VQDLVDAQARGGRDEDDQAVARRALVQERVELVAADRLPRSLACRAKHPAPGTGPSPFPSSRWRRAPTGATLPYRGARAVPRVHRGKPRGKRSKSGANYWSRRPESNRRPADYESAALPAELRRHFHSEPDTWPDSRSFTSTPRPGLACATRGGPGSGQHSGTLAGRRRQAATFLGAKTARRGAPIAPAAHPQSTGGQAERIRFRESRRKQCWSHRATG
jgi:hypothetical protein